MSEPTPVSNRTENILLVIFGLIFALSLCSIVVAVIYVADSPVDATILPICVTPLAIAAGAFAMTWMRHSLKVNFSHFVWSILVWCAGTLLFGFGGFAIVSSFEAADVREDLFYGILLCLLPGAFLMLGGTALYATGYMQQGENDETEI